MSIRHQNFSQNLYSHRKKTQDAPLPTFAASSVWTVARAASPFPTRRIMEGSKRLFQATLGGNHETVRAIPLIFVPRFGILAL